MFLCESEERKRNKITIRFVAFTSDFVFLPKKCKNSMSVYERVEGSPSLPWIPVCVGSSPNMTGLSLLTQGDWAEGTAAHNNGSSVSAKGGHVTGLD